MANCLITKLKGTVNNDRLGKLGEVRLLVPKTATYFAVKADTEDKVLLTLKGGTFDNGRDTMYANVSGFSTGSVNLSAEVGEIIATNKYNITELMCVYPYDFSDFRYSKINSIEFVNNLNEGIVNKLVEIGLNIDSFTEFLYPKYITKLNCSFNGFKRNITGELSSLAALTNLEELSLINTFVTGDISNISNCTKIQILNLSNNDITGNIKSLGKMTSLKKVQIYSTKITGTLEEFVQVQRAAGRTTESEGFNIYLYDTSVTFNGSVQPIEHKLTWTENTITYGDVTVTA